MIDELDLYLHPNWQRTIIRDLKAAFPCLQFIATTHSPFIVQSLEDGELINLDKYDENINPADLPLNIVVTDIMGVDNIRSDSFDNLLTTAKIEFEKIKASKTELTLDDYLAISKAAANLLQHETNDPVYEAYLEMTKRDD